MTFDQFLREIIKYDSEHMLVDKERERFLWFKIRYDYSRIIDLQNEEVERCIVSNVKKR